MSKPITREKFDALTTRERDELKKLLGFESAATDNKVFSELTAINKWLPINDMIKIVRSRTLKAIFVKFL